LQTVPDWEIIYAPEFAPEYEAFKETVQDELVAHLIVLAQEGPQLGRPLVDKLKGSKHANMKELRFGVGGEAWRFAFAFDPARRAVVLVGGNKAGKDQRRFYKRVIETADERFAAHLERMKARR
jgi:hypothetical protein